MNIEIPHLSSLQYFVIRQLKSILIYRNVVTVTDLALGHATTYIAIPHNYITDASMRINGTYLACKCEHNRIPGM